VANHVRQQIREALATVVTSLATTGARVYQSRVVQLEPNELPALLIATNSESIDVLDFVSNPSLERTLTINVTAVAKAVSNLDDTLDQIIKEVEVAVSTSNTLGGLVKDVVLTGIEIEMNADAEMPTGQAVLTFNANYYTRAQAPDVSL
jgi:hypothetical protein